MPGTAAGTCRRKQRNVAVATSSTEALAVALLACNDHVRLEQHSFERDTLLEEGMENSVENHAGDLLAALDRVRPVHEYFRLDDRHELLLLTEGSVPRERVGICTHAGGTWQNVRDMDDRPPLREAGTHGAIRPRGDPADRQAPR